MNYVVIGQVRSKTGGIYPVIDAPESARVACEWQRAWIAMKNLT